MLKTPLCDLLGIEKPVFQGGMAWIADASLASAVSEAGGLGIIAAMNADANWLRDQIHELRARTDKPFGVNVMLMSPFADEVAQVVIDERVPVVVTGAGNPAKYMKAWNEAGIKVIPVVASVALARLVARRGATAVVAEGTESGGHIGETSTMALVPQVVDAVDIPVVAAGGIADGRGVAAAFMLGAAGVQVGTRFLVADECTVSEQYKELVLKAGDTSTRATGRSTGHPVLTALTIVLGMRMMGAMLISSLVIFPALTAMTLLRSFRGVVICAAGLSVVCFCVGLTGSYLWGTPVGATVVLVNLAAFLLSRGVMKLKRAS